MLGAIGALLCVPYLTAIMIYSWQDAMKYWREAEALKKELEEMEKPDNVVQIAEWRDEEWE